MLIGTFAVGSEECPYFTCSGNFYTKYDKKFQMMAGFFLLL